MRKQESCNYSIPRSQLTGMPGTGSGGVYWVVKEAARLQDAAAELRGSVLTTLLVRHLEHIFQVS